jgi:hypothetical protein
VQKPSRREEERRKERKREKGKRGKEMGGREKGEKKKDREGRVGADRGGDRGRSTTRARHSRAVRGEKNRAGGDHGEAVARGRRSPSGAGWDSGEEKEGTVIGNRAGSTAGAECLVGEEFGRQLGFQGFEQNILARNLVW